MISPDTKQIRQSRFCSMTPSKLSSQACMAIVVTSIHLVFFLIIIFPGYLLKSRNPSRRFYKEEISDEFVDQEQIKTSVICTYGSTAIMLIAFLRCQFTDLQSQYEVPIEARDGCHFCNRCNSFIRPGDMRHCDDCGVCVEGYDHHCPCVGVCIGDKNAKYFCQFICWGGITLFCMAWTSIAF